ncbi:DUF2934 domain-containing protein [Bradyrhizobium roseum]|uniref:DUF2934 domain-containing protein n=1 Tax=Bradyrhizobium roseum TaxID=3056648 RepID=UPI002621F0F9|nr:DUF2934 domain-containing protein [Bradyrhizobium roseus]WKA26370.1 DUF2934 domain-containing protein [Bradyrhizobium roseus]
MATEQEIGEFAHQLWENAGKPEGRVDEFWNAAEIELNNKKPGTPPEGIKLE